MSIHTRNQKLAQAAFPCIQIRQRDLNDKDFKDYKSFAKRFPALIHTCGLAQAVAFAQAKGKKDEKEPKKPGQQYLEDLATVMRLCGHHEITDPDKLSQQTRDEPLSRYLRLSREAINAAGWLKRYAEAAGEEE